MSLAQARNTQRGAKNAKHSDKGGDGGGGGKSDSQKNKGGQNGKSHANNSNASGSITSSSSVQEKIIYIMETLEIQCTENQVVAALHDCDFEVNRAVDVLLEGGSSGQSEWTTSGKKKKNRSSAGGAGGSAAAAAPGGGAKPTGLDGAQTHNQSATIQDSDTVAGTAGEIGGREDGGDRDRGGGRRGGGGRGRGRNDNRQYNRRNDSNKENESHPPAFRRNRTSMANGPSGGVGGGGAGGGNFARSGRGGRGGRGGGPGSRTFQGRDRRDGGRDSGRFPSMIDTWCPEGQGAGTGGERGLKMETWNDFPPAEDWDNEEYTGSLADTKVFTPSGLESAAAPNEPSDENSRQELIISSSSANPDYRQSSSPLPVGVGALSAAQTQYLTQLQQQSSESATAAYVNYGQTESLKSAVGIGGNSSAGNAYVQTNSYASYGTQQQQSGAAAGNTTSGSNSYATSAGSNATYASFHSSYASQAAFDTSVSNPAAVAAGSTDSGQQPSRPKGLTRARVPPPSKIPQSAVEMPDDTISASVNSLDVEFGCLEFGSEGNSFDTISNEQQPNKFAGSNVDSANALDPNASSRASSLDGSAAQLDTYGKLSATKSGLSVDPLEKSVYGSDLTKSAADVGLPYSSGAGTGGYGGYAKSASSSAYQQTPYASTFTPSSQQQAAATSYANSSYAQQQPSQYNSAAATPTAGSVYAAAQQQAASYSGQSYGAATGSGSPSGKLSTKESAYSQVTTTSSLSSSANATQSISSLTNNAQTTSTNPSTKVSSSTIKNSLVPNTNIPQPIMSAPQYIVGQAGVSYYQHPPAMFSFEDVHLMQPRIPHMTPGYDFMTYPAPTSLATPGRDTLANVSFTTISDGRYSNASPVPSTLSQQTATAHQQPMINHPSLPPGYAYAYPMPGGFQFGAPLFPLPSAAAAAAAAGTTQASASTQAAPSANNQYKPTGSYGTAAATYGSTAAAGYDTALTQSAADYAKTAAAAAYGKVTAAAGGSVGVGVSGAAAAAAGDLYGKGHAALSKVNSYEKQGFHSGTPPPFHLAAAVAGGQTAGAYAPQLFIPTMAAAAPHQTLMQSHLQDSNSSNSARGGQSANQSGQNKTGGSKPNYGNAYWPPN